MRRYWVLKFGSEDAFTFGFSKNLWVSQYMYGYEEKSAVTNNWENFKDIQTGDLCIAGYRTGCYLGKKPKFFAVGVIMKPLKPANCIDNIDNVIEKGKKENAHLYDSGIIHYEDTAFYEDYVDQTEFEIGLRPQRLQVHWKYVFPEGVFCKGINRAVKKSYRTSAYEIDEEFYMIVKNKLKRYF